MRLLVLGGTAFVGRHIVSAAADAGHEITLFNRGKTNDDLFPQLDHRRGDRSSGDLESLARGEWDAVVDATAYVPRHVRQATDALAGRVGTYCLISTVSVYADVDALGADEDARLAEPPDPDSEEQTDRTYGPLKVLCEQETARAFPDSALIIRPGVVAGPYDGSERFAYWVRRVAAGGTVLGPPRPEQPVQVIDARDQARFVVALLEERTTGVFNTVGVSMTFAAMLEACAAAAGADLHVVWAPQDAFRAHKVVLPLSLPASGRWDGAYSRSGAKAVGRGLQIRPVVETARDTLAWDRTRDPARYRGPSADQEAAVLAWS